MASFLLVHGAWHGAWCWERLVPLLLQGGHDAVAVDLPGHGADATPAWRVTLARYAGRVVEAASALPERPVAVGHSMGGMVITQAAAFHPAAFAGLVYLCAFAPRAGDSLLSLGRQDRETGIPGSTRFTLSGIRMRSERARDVFYGECSGEDAAWAAARLVRQPLVPLIQGLRGEPSEALPRAYVECTRDRAISPGRQRAMAKRAGIGRVVTMETDHSPFLSAPAELAAHLAALASV